MGLPAAKNVHATHTWWLYKALRDHATKYFWVRGGFGAAKTTNAATWFLDRCFLNAAPKESPIPSLSWAVAQTHGKIEDTLIPAFQDRLLEVYEMEPDLHYRIVRGKQTRLIFKNINHEVHFKSGDRPDLLAGTNITHWLITECGLQPREVYNRCVQRGRSKFGKLIQGMGEGTPENDPRADWYEEIANFVGFDPTGRHCVFEVWTEENPHLKPSTREFVRTLEELYAYDPIRLEAYLYGRFVRFQKGTAYKNYRPHAHDIDDIAPDPHRDIFLTFDFNANPMAWVALQRIPFDEGRRRVFRWVAIHDASEGHGLLDEACLEFSEKFPVGRFGNTPIRIYGDRSGHSQSHKIRGTDYDNARRYLRDLKYRQVEVRAGHVNPLETDSVEALNRLFLEDLHRVCKRCAKYRASLQETAWREGTRKLLKPSGETHTHHSDAVKYFAYQVTRSDTGQAADFRPVMGMNI